MYNRLPEDESTVSKHLEGIKVKVKVALGQATKAHRGVEV
jgi:hypothetical protein